MTLRLDKNLTKIPYFKIFTCNSRLPNNKIPHSGGVEMADLKPGRYKFRLYIKDTRIFDGKLHELYEKIVNDFEWFKSYNNGS